jgi:malonate-semialdehyde dehydrogenase (acetylating)/methylmalonate-semialdehyde dehydrogenase
MVQKTNQKDAERAVQAAFNAKTKIAGMDASDRAKILDKMGDLLEQNKSEFTDIIMKESGKTMKQAQGEIGSSIERLHLAADEAKEIRGEIIKGDIASDKKSMGMAIRQPLGVFGVIGPFNFPFMIPLWSAPYALATGNCVVVKPSSEVPNSQTRLAELVDEAGFPPGVWNLVHGGRTVVNGMLDHPDIKGITFVGSTPTAKFIYERCGATGKRVIAQGGAKNYMVIMPDCDVRSTIPALMTSFFGNAGQRCLSGANLVIVGEDDNLYNRFLDGLADTTARIIVGYGLDEAVQMGPVRDKDKKARIMGYIESGMKQGAKIRVDGRKAVKIRGAYPDTCFLGPTILENVTPDMKCGAEEIFGPVMSVMRAKDLDQAIDMCNACTFGNAHAIFTSSGKNAREFQYRVVSGNLGINIGIVAPMAWFPFSGAKESFFGVLHTQGQEAIRFFTESKVVIQRWP